MKWIKRILIGIVLLLAVVFVALYAWLSNSKPLYAGECKASGLEAKVDVFFDEYGIPHIYAENKHDMYLAFGYVHAQDRLFQMELLRRAGSGRLAEIIGRPMLKVDKMFRSLGLTEYAKESAAYFETTKGTPMYADVLAYLEGINQFIAEGATPPEFSIIGIEKKPFTVEDLYYITGAMSFSFSQAQKTEPVIDFISKKYGEEYLHDMGLWHDSSESFIRSYDKRFAPQPEAIPSTSKVVIPGRASAPLHNDVDPALMMAQLMNEVEGLLPMAPLEGSNAWVVSGKKTKNGEVIFCNDTHIGYLLPQTWYEAHLNAPGYEMYGHFMSGIPFSLVGRNRNLSWGLTMLLNDDMDFYSETINPENNSQYIYKGNALDFEVKPQVIKIKGEADTTIDVRYTLHGPVINDAFEGMEQDQPISMFWTYTQKPNRNLDALHGLNNAKTMSQFESFLPMIHAPGLNVNYGDKDGNVAWWACASLIQRPLQVNSWTMLDGASGNDDIIGYYDFDKNPRCINPEWGYIYSANDWPQQIDNASISSLLSIKYIGLIDIEKYKLWYPGYYKPQYRADRIRQLLESRDDWSLESIQDVMTDHTSAADASLLSDMHTVLEENKSYTDSSFYRQYDLLFNWDGGYELNSTSPTLFNKMLYHYLHMAMADEMGEERFALFLQTHQLQRTQVQLFQREDSKWWDDIHTVEIETRADIIFKAYAKSLVELRAQFGNNPKIWNWRKAASLEMKHPLGEVSILRPIFNVGPEPVNGGNETILQSGFKLDSTGEYNIFFGSQMRIIVDFAKVDSALNITPCGQSGHIASKHYKDQAKLYREMKFRPQWMNRDQVEGFDHLVLH